MVVIDIMYNKYGHELWYITVIMVLLLKYNKYLNQKDIINNITVLTQQEDKIMIYTRKDLVMT